MNMTWINRGVYSLLERIGNFQFFFMDVAKWASAICFLLALGFVCIEIFMQSCDPRKELIKLLVTVVSYFVMIYFFPIVMKNLLSFGMNLGYGAVFEQGLYEANLSTNNNSSFHANISDFYKWLDEESGGIFSTTTNEDGSKIALNFNLVDSKTGYIDLNKTFTYILAFVKIGWKCFPTLTLFKASFTAIGVCFLYMFALLVVIICYFVVLINYVMALIDYFALMGYGVLMIPLSLWKGTKGYTQAVMGAIGRILIKLIVISSLMFLSIMSIVDLFTQVYVHSVIVKGVTLAIEIDDLLNMSVTLLFQAPLLAVITMQTEKIASLLSSGNPQLSFGDFALGAAQSAAMGTGAAISTNGVVKGAATAASSISSGIVGGMAARSLGGGARSIAKSAVGSAMDTFSTSLGGSFKNFPHNMATSVNDFGRMTGMSRANGNRNLIPVSRLSSFGVEDTPTNNKEKVMPFSSVNKPETKESSVGNDNSSSSKVSSSSNNNEIPSYYGNANNEVVKENPFDSGREGVYGNIFSPESSQTFTDKAIKKANKLSRGGVASRILGSHIGEVGAVVNSIKNTHLEHMNDDVSNNGYIKNATKEIFKSRLSNSANAYGGSKVIFDAKDKNAPEKLKGKSANVLSRGSGSFTTITNDNKMGVNRYVLSSNKEFFDALNGKENNKDGTEGKV